MRVPTLDNHRSMIHGVFLILFGIILGAILMLLYFSKELDNLYTQIIVLENEKQNLVERIIVTEKELKSWNARSKINDVIIHIKEAPNDIVETEIHRKVLTDIRFLIGKEIGTIENAYESIFEIFSPKIYTIDTKEYRVTLINMVIGTKLHMYLLVQ